MLLHIWRTPNKYFLRLADVIKQHLDRQQNVITEVQEDRANMIKALRSLELQTLPPSPQNKVGANMLTPERIWGQTLTHQLCLGGRGGTQKMHIPEVLLNYVRHQ